jgi:hypothetical protein
MFLALSHPLASPAELVSADWLSLLAVVRGQRGFSLLETWSTRVSWIGFRVPLCLHWSKLRHTLLLGGKSLGKNRHWQLVRSR